MAPQTQRDGGVGGSSGAAQVVLFQLAGKSFAVGLGEVEQIIDYREPTKTPRRPPHVEGVIEHRGRYFALVNLRKRFGVAEPGPAHPAILLITGAGPIGLLGALIGKQLGIDVHVLARTTTGPKPDLVRALGGTYHSCAVVDVGFEPDVILECTGVGQVIAESIAVIGASGIVCLTGVGHGGSLPKIATADMASSAVLKNNVVFGSVNANKRQWYKAAEALSRADRSWLAGLITRRERPEDFARALDRNSEDIKVVIQFSEI